MRSSRVRHLPLTAPRSAHARAKELADIDRQPESTPRLAELVAADLPQAKGASADTGRPGLTGDQVLRASIVRSLEGCSDADLGFHPSPRYLLWVAESTYG
jgi:hypothetical protein